MEENKNIALLIARIGKLEKKVAALVAANRISSPMNVRGDVICEAFEKHFREAGSEEVGMELTVSELAAEIGVDCAPVPMGRILSMMGVDQVNRKRKGKSVRLYRVVRL